MYRGPVDNLKVILIPSWLNEVIPTQNGIKQYDLVLKIGCLIDILNTEDLFNFIKSQKELNRLYSGAFADIPTINYEAQYTDNLIPDVSVDDFKKEHERALNNLDWKKRIEDMKERRGLNPVYKGEESNTEEYYVPMLLDQEYLLLVGTVESPYKDPRAFFNELLELLNRNGYGFESFKHKCLFKHYLYNAISN